MDNLHDFNVSIFQKYSHINHSNHNTMTDLTNKPIEQHPFAPVLPANADIMMMGTFPPTQDKWAMPFHYPNFYNDMWRIYGAVFFDDIDYFRDGEQNRFDHKRIIKFMHVHNIASCPTVRSAIREEGNAADKHLTVVESVNLADILTQVPKVQHIFTTGGKATEILLGLLPKDKQLPKSKHPKTNQHMTYPITDSTGKQRLLTLHRLPSTSRAYPLAFAKKVLAYQQFFISVGKLSSA